LAIVIAHNSSAGVGEFSILRNFDIPLKLGGEQGARSGDGGNEQRPMADGRTGRRAKGAGPWRWWRCIGARRGAFIRLSFFECVESGLTGTGSSRLRVVAHNRAVPPCGLSGIRPTPPRMSASTGSRLRSGDRFRGCPVGDLLRPGLDQATHQCATVLRPLVPWSLGPSVR